MSSLDLEAILPLVKSPARYLGNEYNSIHKEGNSRLKVGLCFPDVYEIGMSNLGLQILYDIINRRADAVAERIFSPGTDLENLLRARNLPLFSLESKRPLKEFDLLAFSLSCELGYTNALNILELGRIPLLASQRDKRFPLIIAGGMCAFNPEPVADFIDVFVLGEGEEVIGEIIETISGQRAEGREQKAESCKRELLKRLARIEGIYVPSFYKIQYFPDGKLRGLKPILPDMPAKIHKRVVKDLDKASYPVRPIVPYTDIVHNRIPIEIERGCGRGCRFCQAGAIWRPVRRRSREKVLEIARASLQSTGDEEISLLALSPTDYPGIGDLIEDLKNRRVQVSLPSQRVDNIILPLVSQFGPNRKMGFTPLDRQRCHLTGFTFAPEAGTGEVRNLINKPLAEEKFLLAFRLVSEQGGKLVKLYFMVGLPGQGWEDIEGMVKLMRKARAQNPRLNFNFTISPFVPKAHTPFQWVAQVTPEELNPQIQYLRRQLPGKVKAHNPQASWLEGIFARGDRRLGKVLIKAFFKGCKFDLWAEQFKFEPWQQAFRECGIEADFYTRARDLAEILPWDHLDSGVEKKWLLEEYRKTLSKVTSSEQRAGGREQKAESREQQAESREQQAEGRGQRAESSGYQLPITSRQRVRLKFSKEGDLKFLSYLELRMMILRAFRRAKLPLLYSNGFHSQPRVCFSPPLSLGVESSAEFVDLWLSRPAELSQLAKAISEQLPCPGRGLRIYEVREIPLFFPSLNSALTKSLYEIILLMDRKSVQEKIERVQRGQEFYIQKPTLQGSKIIDLKQSLIDLKIDSLIPDGVKMLCWLKITPGVGNLPRTIAQLFDTGIDKLKIRRLALE